MHRWRIKIDSQLEEEIKELKVEKAQHKPLAQAQSQAQSEAQAQMEDEDGVAKWWRTGYVIQGLHLVQDRASTTDKIKLKYGMIVILRTELPDLIHM